MSKERRNLGSWGESLAADILVGKGYRILERNHRTPYGEIDLVAEIKDRLVFVEVKTRSTAAYGHPEASITPKKREHLISSAQAYLQEYCDPDTSWRIDVVAIRKLKPPEPPEIIHFENAIT